MEGFTVIIIIIIIIMVELDVLTDKFKHLLRVYDSLNSAILA